MLQTKMIKLIAVLTITLSTSAFAARHFTTFGRGHGQDHYGNAYAACNIAQRNAHYSAVQGCRSYYGTVHAVSVSGCNCIRRGMRGYPSVACVADARAACSAKRKHLPPRYRR